MSDARTTQAREKRDLARRARRLAHTQVADVDRAELLDFADELDKEAEVLEQQPAAIWLPPGNGHDQVPCQHPPSVEAASQPPLAEKKDG